LSNWQDINTKSKINKRFYIRIIGLLWLLFSFNSCSVKKYLKENEYLVERNVIKHDNLKIDQSELNSFIRQKPNRKILKIVPFNLWLYFQIDQKKMIYFREKRDLKYDRINEKRIEKNRIKNEKRKRKGKPLKFPKLKSKDKLTLRESILDAGEAPVILDSSITRITDSQLKKFVFSRGYFDSNVRDSLVFNKRRKTVQEFYFISKSEPYYIKNINYKIEDPLMEYFIFNDTMESVIKRNSIYNEDLMQKERERISERQLNNGYFLFAPEYIYFEVDTNLSGKEINLTIGLKKFIDPMIKNTDTVIYKSHPRFYIENVFVVPEFVPDFNGKINDIYCKDTTFYNDIKILHNESLKIKKKDLLRDVTVSPGQLYQQNLSENTFKGLSSLNVFRNVFIQYVPNLTFPDRLDCYILCQPKVKQALSFQTEGTNTSGNLGIAGSLVFQNKNMFKGAEQLELKLKGSIAAQRQFNADQTADEIKDVQSTFNTIEFGPELNLFVPRPLFPFTLFYYKKDAFEKRYFSQPKTIFHLSTNFQRRQEFSRTIYNLSYGFKFSNSKGLFNYEILPIETYMVKAQLYGNFRNDLFALNDFFLLNSFIDHITTLSRISVGYNNQRIKNKKLLMYLKMNLSSSGNILRGAYSLANQPKDSLGRYQISNIPFSQFVKIEGDYRFYLKIRKLGQVVWRIAGGFGKPLDNLSVLPYEQSFFGGGPNGVRAWRARTLGPGGFDQSLSSTRFDKIGNIQLESNFEYRFHLFKSFYGAWFVDAGNIWTSYTDPQKPNGKFQSSEFYKEIAIGSGFGLRYDFSFFILRFDLAVRVRDPQYAENDRWMFDKQPIRKTTILNFGIGYPF
jgi:outer membrane translocation and assembly module TamA